MAENEHEEMKEEKAVAENATNVANKVSAAAQESKNAESAEASAKTDAPAEENDAQTAAPSSSEPDKKDDELETVKKALADANDRNLRLMAEFENFRRRNAKEQLELIETANGKLLEKFSEVQDNFERAFAAENKAKDLEAFEKGMQMIYNQFAKVLSDAGLEQIDPTGKEFDPNLHEALMQQPSETIPEGHVVTVFQKGYKLKNKILKTAKVIVSSGK